MKAVLRIALMASLVSAPLAAQTSSDLTEAARLIEADRPADAKPLLLALLRREPANLRAAYLAGQVHVMLDEGEAAAKLLERVVQAEPSNAEYHLWLGRAYGQQAQNASKLRQPGLAKKTKTELERTIALDPRNVDARGHLIQFHLQAPGIVGGDKKKALQYAQEIATLNRWRGLHELANVHVAMRDNAAAEKVMSEIVTSFPDSTGPRINMSVHYQNVGRFDYAHEVIAPLLSKTPPTPGALYQVGRIGAVSGQNLDRAERALRDYLSLTLAPGQPTHAAAHWRLGMLAEHRGDKAAARREYEASLAIDPEFPQSIEALKKLR